MINLQVIFWRNVRALCLHRMGDDEFPALEKLTGISRKTLWQQSKCLHAMGLDSVDTIAQALGVEAWQLLVPTFDPANLPACITQKQKQALTALTS